MLYIWNPNKHYQSDGAGSWSLSVNEAQAINSAIEAECQDNKPAANAEKCQAICKTPDPNWIWKGTMTGEGCDCDCRPGWTRTEDWAISSIMCKPI
jgi:hypothetical protein